MTEANVTPENFDYFIKNTAKQLGYLVDISKNDYKRIAMNKGILGCITLGRIINKNDDRHIRFMISNQVDSFKNLQDTLNNNFEVTTKVEDDTYQIIIYLVEPKKVA